MFQADAAWNQEYSWNVVEAFFAERGLVKQQIDSFDQFMYTTMQEVVDESFTLEFDVDTADDEDDRVGFLLVLVFASIRVSCSLPHNHSFRPPPPRSTRPSLSHRFQPHHIEVKFGSVSISQPVFRESDGTYEILTPNVARLRNLSYCGPLMVDVTRTDYRLDANGRKEDVAEETVRCPLGEVPIMLKSKGCMLKQNIDRPTSDFGECPHDEGGCV